jgi:hypothetical protein
VINIPGAGTTCSANENVPAGFSLADNTCLNVLLPQGGTASCTITNVATPGPGFGTFTINKIYVGRLGPDVSLSLTCDNGAVVSGAGTGSASPGFPAHFSVTNIAAAGTTCSANEVVPAGFSLTGNTCESVHLASGGHASCTFINTALGTPITFLPPSTPPTIQPPTLLFPPTLLLPPTVLFPGPRAFSSVIRGTGIPLFSQTLGARLTGPSLGQVAANRAEVSALPKTGNAGILEEAGQNTGFFGVVLVITSALLLVMNVQASRRTS